MTASGRPALFVTGRYRRAQSRWQLPGWPARQVVDAARPSPDIRAPDL